MKRFKKCIATVMLSGLIASCFAQVSKGNYQVIPLPQEIINNQGEPFIINNAVKIVCPQRNNKMRKNAQFLADYIKDATGKQLAVITNASADHAIVIKLKSASTNKEAYKLTVTNKNITISAATEAGIFYGIQTLRKSIPLVKTETDIVMPAVQINDYPRFGYRGMMLDVGRHFFPVTFIKKYIDILALHNINNFHWHLTEDQGWRIEIKKYPNLTKVGSKRTETVIGHNSGTFDGIPYEGFYTQAQIKEIVAYAQDRFITIIPEIDMPGHMLGALASYPEFGCTGGPYKVGTQWGVNDDVLCVGNEKTMQFVEDVLGELIQLFPSKYIHIGGDECPKVRWKTCQKCQARIKAEGLVADAKHSAEDRLQSYCISRAEKFLNSKGRKIIGWDEILEGGLAPNATVMSWRGMSGGIEAAKQKHDVIMTPNSHMYFDHYQSTDTEKEPIAIGGYLPVNVVYSFEPVPASLTEDEKKYILGAQANLWTEYVPTTKQVEYMLLPRMAALCEVQWTMPEKKNYQDFLTRIPRLIDIYKVQNYNFATHLFDVNASFNPNSADGTLDVVLTTIDGADIFYTLDGLVPTKSSSKYNGLLKIKSRCTLRAVVSRKKGYSSLFTEDISFSKSSLKPITINTLINQQYKYNGAATLVDGLKGNGNYKTGRWIAFCKNDMEAIIDLQNSTEISNAEIETCVVKGDWVFDSKGFSVSVSDDGISYKQVASQAYSAMQQTDKDGVYKHQLTFDAVKTRYVKITVLSENQLPAWHGGKGSPGYLFVDEIILN